MNIITIMEKIAKNISESRTLNGEEQSMLYEVMEGIRNYQEAEDDKIADQMLENIQEYKQDYDLPQE